MVPIVVRMLVEDFEKDADGNAILDDDGNRQPIYAADGSDKDGVEDRTDPRWFEGRQAITEEFIDVLPSVNMTLEVFEGFEAYVGWAKVLARPNINDLNINADCTFLDYPKARTFSYANTCDEGNPDLDPYRATQYEVALTWYPDETSIVSGSYFVKDITSYIFGKEWHEDVDFFTFLPGFLKNTGMKANYTYTTADNVDDINPLTGELLPLKGQSEGAYNVEGFYEDEQWSVKLTYNYRDEYYSHVFADFPVFVEGAGYLDGKITYRYNDNLKFYVDGRNLAKEAKTEIAGVGRVNDLQWSGRIFSVGFTYKM